MTDPMDALNGLQQALDANIVQMHACELFPSMAVLLDHPNDTPRFTYAKVLNGKVHAIALFVKTGFIEDTPCFQTGYAVAVDQRNGGLGAQIVQQGLAELQNSMSRTLIKEFFVEAIVSTENTPSNKIATQLLSQSPISCKDEFTNEPALQYLRKIVCNA